MKKPCVVLGVTGSIAAYRAADIAHRLVKAGCEVHCILTKSAQQLITERTMETMSGQPCITDMFTPPKQWEVEHIELAKRADVFLVAPATANFVGKMASGIADDMLTTTVMATKAPVLVALAMNTNMYENPVTQKNIAYLRSIGVRFLEPIEGDLACGTVGKGHIPETDDIVRATLDAMEEQRQPKDLTGLTVAVTAGPTREPIDPVRYITNKSSGKMGYAIARAAQLRGARVLLISGPTALEAPAGVEMVRVESTKDLLDALLPAAEQADIVVQAAAPADYRVAEVAPQKIKKQDGEPFVLTLTENPDVAKAVGENKRENQVLVGFAAETQAVRANATRKLDKKHLDFIVANDVTKPGAGFDVDTNIAAFLDHDGIEELPLMTKDALAHRILDRALAVLRAKQAR